MKILLALVITGASALAATHIVDSTVTLGDGVTPAAAGRMVVQGFAANSVGSFTVLTSTVTVQIRNGAVDFQLGGGANVHYQARVYITTADGRTVLSSYDEPPWVVPDTGSVLTIRDIRGAAVANATYLRNGVYCITVANARWTQTPNACGGTGGALFDSVTGLFDDAAGLFDAH